MAGTGTTVAVRSEIDKDFVVKDFAGVNTQATRTAIAENEFSWLENMMPVGYANLKCVPYQGSPVATIASVTINYWKYVNINNTDFLMIFTVGGSVHALNLSSYVVTNVRPGGTLTGTVACCQWKNERVLIIAGNGYFDWDGTTWTSNGGVTSAPSSGQTIASFAGRVWIGASRTVSFSAPNSYTDFQTASAGGSFIITDETLHSNINNLTTANNFLYIFGDSSINVVSDVRVVTGPITVFSNTNVSALIGSNLSASIFTYYRTIAFGTRYGFYALYGSTPQKISDPLDGVVPLIDFAQPVSGGVANIFNILCMCFLFRYNDPAGARPLLGLFFNKKWFFCSQGSALSLVAGGFQSGTPAIFGTDGTSIWKLFSDGTTSIATMVQTALWPLKFPTRMKEGLKAGVEITSSIVATTQVTLSLDSDFGSIPITLSANNTGQWVDYAHAESGNNYLALSGSGVSDNPPPPETYTNTPDAAANRILGDIEFISYIDSLAHPSGFSSVIASKADSTKFAFSFWITASLQLEIWTSTNGNTIVFGTSTATLSVGGKWVRGSLDVNNGSGQHVYNFDFSNDPPDTDPLAVNWTQLGATVTAGGVLSIFNSNATVDVGYIDFGGFNNASFFGKIYSVYVYNGLTTAGGTLAFSMVPNDTQRTATSWSSLLTSETWTLQNGARLLGNHVNATAVTTLGSWINNAGTVGDWIATGFQIYQADAEFKGRYLGYTMRSTTPAYVLNGFLNQHQVSTPWATRAS